MMIFQFLCHALFGELDVLTMNLGLCETMFKASNEHVLKVITYPSYGSIQISDFAPIDD